MHIRWLLLTISFFQLSACLPRKRGQALRRRANTERAQAVKDAFDFAWKGYYTYAFPNDELRPVSNGVANSRNGWGATAIDALSTAIVMEDEAIVNAILDYIPSINFARSRNNQRVNLFETNIRYIGGLLSAYDFLSGPMAHLAHNQANVKALLTQATKLADLLSFAFNTPTGIPYNEVFFNNRSVSDSATNNLAQVGSLVLEWTHLSDLTGNPKYARLVQKAESYLLNPRPMDSSHYPGLLGYDIYLRNGSFADFAGGWVGGADSYYEYLIKMFLYDKNRFGKYRDHWVQAVDSSIKYLASHPSSKPSITYLAQYDHKSLYLESQHLACFSGGNFILGGKVLKRADITNFGLQLVAGCRNTYTSTITGIGPEIFSWNPRNLTAEQASFYNQHGFWIKDPFYDLRPEVVESYYYAYQATKDPMYQDWAWDAFNAIMAVSKTSSGFAPIKNVTLPDGGGQHDFQESFFFAETLKYLYLIQSDQQPWDVNYGRNQWVFNTEGHPFKVAGPPI